MEGHIGRSLGRGHAGDRNGRFNGRTWLDTAEHPHSDQLRVTERMTRPDYDHIVDDITMEDPKFVGVEEINALLHVLPQADEERPDVRAHEAGPGALRILV